MLLFGPIGTTVRDVIPEGTPEMSDVSPLSGISGLQLIPLYYLLSCFSAYSHGSFCLFFFLLMAHSLDFFLSRKFFNLFCLKIGLLVWLLFSSYEIMIGRWYVQLAAI